MHIRQTLYCDNKSTLWNLLECERKQLVFKEFQEKKSSIKKVLILKADQNCMEIFFILICDISTRYLFNLRRESGIKSANG